ncbi:MAG TPA: peptide ABC transporter substrate-binding protein [bacterium]|nr:peptide ABC transporter substrate-binding protein [bacterium]
MASERSEEIIAALASGRISRREALKRLALLGISAGGITSLLSTAAPRTARAAGRGGSGTVKILYWEAPTIVNPHLAQGTKDFDASRVCLEPLLTVDAAGRFSPVLAANVPSRANGQVAADGRSVVYKLKRGVRWGDGRPFTADDVAFTYQFIANKETGATTYATYDNVATVEALDPLAVKITFKKPTPAWYLPFVGGNGMILPRHALDAYVGSGARNAPFNLKAFGTGPYKVDTFRPGDLVVYSINPYYREPGKPAFDQVQLKGGGDATSAARAVLETAEYDYAWNLQVEWPVLQHLAEGGKGKVITGHGGGVEQIYCNMSDPNRTLDGQRSSVRAPHPFLADARVRQAMGLAIDRMTIARELYGEEGDATVDVLTTPTTYLSPNEKIEYDIDKANRLLDEAGYRRGPDGIRRKGAVAFNVTYQTSVNPLRQKEQEIVKAGWAKIGVGALLKSVDAGVFFSSSPGNNDTYAHFYTDVEMFTSTFGSPFPGTYMGRFYSGDLAKDVPQRENNWSGLDITRWVDKEYNALYEQALVELDPAKNRELWIRMNDRVVSQGVSLPIIDRKQVSAHVTTLDVAENLSPFDAETRNIADWRRTG